MIVDDHAGIRLLLGAYLGRKYDVTTVRNGMDGLSLLSSGETPDLIVLDMDMPDLNGYGFLQQIRSSGYLGNIPVIMVSGSEDQQTREACRQLGVSGMFNKPFNPSQLHDTIELTLHQYGN